MQCENYDYGPPLRHTVGVLVRYVCFVACMVPIYPHVSKKEYEGSKFRFYHLCFIVKWFYIKEKNNPSV